jgi:hypothetical protein
LEGLVGLQRHRNVGSYVNECRGTQGYIKINFFLTPEDVNTVYMIATERRTSAVATAAFNIDILVRHQV